MCSSDLKYKEKILKTAREKQQITYKGIPKRSKADLSAETLQARRKWKNIFTVVKRKNLQPRLLYPARVSFTFDRAIKTFTEGFPGGAVVENPPANAGDTGSSPGPGRSHMPRSN